MFWAIIDLPTPFGPTSTTLVASLRNSSVISVSMATRSQRLGQAQSKSQSALKRPIWAVRNRRSRLRRARSCSSQPSNDVTQVSLAISPQGLAGGSSLCETVIGAVLAGGPLVVDQPLDVGGIFDLRPLVVAAPMAGEDVCAVGDAHLMRIGEHGQNAPDMGVRNRIIVEVEADIGRLADRHRDALQQRRRVARQSQQSRRFVGEYLADGALGFVRAAPVGGRAIAPGVGLGV